jgi:hypothetical protein
MCRAAAAPLNGTGTYCASANADFTLHWAHNMSTRAGAIMMK